MKRLILGSAILLATSLGSVAHASSGVIEFTGTISAATCVVNGGAGGGSATLIPIGLGSVSIADLSTGTGTAFGAETRIPVAIDCSASGGMTSVAMRFAPFAGSGVDTVDSRLLKTTGTATGVGIGLINSDNTLVDLGGSAESSFTALTVVPGPPATATANLVMRAAYIRATTGTAVPTGGTANGTLPFTLTYM